jgi:hypothetical protein
LYGLVLIPEYLDRRDDRVERKELETAATAMMPRYQPTKERDFDPATERLSA